MGSAGAARHAAPPAGRRVGTKRSDTRWEDEHGYIWASRFECAVWQALRAAHGDSAKRCERGADTFTYKSPAKQAVCSECGSRKAFTNRTYTPDFFVSPRAGHGSSVNVGYYIEAKGYLRADKRRLLRDFRASRPDIDLRLLVERDYKVSDTLTIRQWAARYLRCKTALFVSGSAPVWEE